MHAEQPSARAPREGLLCVQESRSVSPAVCTVVSITTHQHTRAPTPSWSQPGVSTILGQIAQSAPGAPDFHLMDVAAVAGSGGEQGLTFQVGVGTGAT